ncbi:hypothetical protein K438DRAFT_1789224 [Mycena galopus ATCC 62051]|nr:hypothetical protein K438DRAFT_1789224 [Mycena galopus ATCC 62051]
MNKNPQSMLYRFREAQEPELSRGAAHGQRMQELARERAVAGELLSEISRKVLKIQDEARAQKLGPTSKRGKPVKSEGEGSEGRVQFQVKSKAEVRPKGTEKEEAE